MTSLVCVFRKDDAASTPYRGGRFVHAFLTTGRVRTDRPPNKCRRGNSSFHPDRKKADRRVGGSKNEWGPKRDADVPSCGARSRLLPESCNAPGRCSRSRWLDSPRRSGTVGQAFPVHALQRRRRQPSRPVRSPVVWIGAAPARRLAVLATAKPGRNRRTTAR